MASYKALSKQSLRSVIIVGLAGIRKTCEENNLDFMTLVTDSLKNEMAKCDIENLIDVLEGADTEEDFLKYLKLNSSKGGGFA